MIRGIQDDRNTFCGQGAKRAAGREYRARAVWRWATRLLDTGNGKGGRGGEGGGGAGSLARSRRSVRDEGGEGDRPTGHSRTFHLKIQK